MVPAISPLINIVVALTFTVVSLFALFCISNKVTNTTRKTYA